MMWPVCSGYAVETILGLEYFHRNRHVDCTQVAHIHVLHGHSKSKRQQLIADVSVTMAK